MGVVRMYRCGYFSLYTPLVLALFWAASSLFLCSFLKCFFIVVIIIVDSINRDERVFHCRNTLQMGEYLALGTLPRILNTTIGFCGGFPIERVYNSAIIAQFTCVPREVKKIAIWRFTSSSSYYSSVDLAR